MANQTLNATHTYHAAATLDLKRGRTGIKIAKMANDQCCIPLCNNDEQFNGGKDPSYITFPRDKQRRKRSPSLEYIIHLEYIVYACQVSFQIQNGRCVIRVYSTS